MSTAKVTAQRKIGSRRAEIQDAAATLFARQGYSGTGMEQIAAAVGLVPASLYNHWPSKQAILAEIIVTYEVETLEAFNRAIRDKLTAGDALYAAATTRLSYLLRHGRQAAITDREKLLLDAESLTRVHGLQNAHFTGLRALVEQGQRQGEFDQDTDSLFATVALLEMGTRLATSFLHQAEYPSWGEVSGAGTVLQMSDGEVLANMDEASAQYATMALRMVSHHPA
ncbi:TetR/AcrR family transcriptional regulator [Herbiconiux sp. CPCC 203407]|uniref:TetR/AcrR family transcriptional regulator n=1 Tax=Herbiconiux oxytropis TaxID=2970915 RepID=A0AA41XJJ2_9MICO|nr:TetR/AcrR family transcriptional regulator [Herbiconiux oxytropis]MCS5721834.1 TetR/AcrR family transcriptional regulator [Herbiconiux oxytropis]MCS5727360.1 TetR/AcrR family transcriptional regulator [Herbiconiux oxytropis]